MMDFFLVVKVWASKAWVFIKKHWQIFVADNYQQIIAKIEKKYEERKEELSEEKKAEVNKLVSKYREDPATLSRLLAERFGVTYVGGGEE
jgi:hypothetical protein